MKTFKTFALVLFAMIFIFSCEEAPSDDTNSTSSDNPEIESTVTESDEEIPEETPEEETPQTVEERIQEIKSLYSQIQKSSNPNKNCTNKSVTTMNYDVIDEGIPFENTGKKCQLENNLKYEQVTVNGYEWSETTSFYYKDNQRFFTYLSGGAEACGYDYRVYYDKNGEVIRVLLAENECDGEEVSAPFEVKEEGRKKEILNAIRAAENELNSLFGEK